MKSFYQNIGSDYLTVSESYGIYPSHFHTGVEILYSIKNDLIVSVNGVNFVVKENEFIFIDANFIHSVIKSTEYLTLIIPYIYLNDFNAYSNGKTLENLVLADDNGEFLSLIYEIKNSKDKNAVYKHGVVNQLLGKIIEKSVLITKNLKQVDGLREVFIYINENFTENLSLPFLAKKFGYNKFYLSSAFNSYFNSSLTDYLIKLRLEKFINEYNKNSESIITTVYNCGFSSIQTFYRVFKKRYGVSPKKYFN